MTFRVIERDRRDMLGEGPTWIATRAELLWVDIMAPAVHRLHLPTGAISTLTVDEPIGWVLPRAADAQVVAGFRSGFALLDLETGERGAIGTPEPDRPDNRLNDAKADSAGRIWAGSKDDTDRTATGALYRLDPDHCWHRLDDGYGVTNGPTFSLDGRTLYHSDSAARSVYAFDLAACGTLSGKRVWLRFSEDWGYPDGMTTDSEGCVWIAHWAGGRISRFSPDAQLIRAIELPAPNITSIAFAGKRLDRMFVTSAALESAGHPQAGALFEVTTGITGVAPRLFAG